MLDHPLPLDRTDSALLFHQTATGQVDGLAVRLIQDGTAGNTRWQHGRVGSLCRQRETVYVLRSRKLCRSASPDTSGSLRARQSAAS